MAKSNAEKTRQFRERHPQQAEEQRKRYRTHLKEEVLLHYGNGKLACVKCGFIDIRALTIDHINALGKLGRERDTLTLYRKLKKMNYPEGYQTLCMNCQFIKRYENNECARPFWRFPPKE